MIISLAQAVAGEAQGLALQQSGGTRYNQRHRAARLLPCCAEKLSLPRPCPDL